MKVGGGLFVAIPHKEVGAARREIYRLSRNWPRNGGELSGSVRGSGRNSPGLLGKTGIPLPLCYVCFRQLRT